MHARTQETPSPFAVYAPGDAAPACAPVAAPVAAPPAPSRWRLRALAVLWAGTLTLTMQAWVGGTTIYRQELAAKVEQLHGAILRNAPPTGRTWSEIGANGTNVRIATVAVGEALHEATGLSVRATYRALDTVMLFAGLLLLVAYLARVAPPAEALVGTLYVGTMLPLTYQFGYFHPWDRPALVTWLALLLLLHRRRLGWAALALPLAVAVKYDVMLLPAVHLLTQADWSPRRLRRAVAETAGLLAIGVGTYAALLAARPGGSRPASVSAQLATNLGDLRALHLTYPPLLGFALPLVLAALGARTATPWTRGCALFGVLLFVPFALQSNLVEFRAQVPVLLLLLPAALEGLRATLAPYARMRDAAGPA